MMIAFFMTSPAPFTAENLQNGREISSEPHSQCYEVVLDAVLDTYCQASGERQHFPGQNIVSGAANFSHWSWLPIL